MVEMTIQAVRRGQRVRRAAKITQTRALQVPGHVSLVPIGLEAASEECLDFRPGADFVTIREQASHLSEVQGVYQLAFAGEEPDFGRKPEFAPTSGDVEAILTALAERDRELVDLLDRLRPEQDQFRISWYGNQMTVAGFGSVFIQHESLHHGQWAAYAALGGYDRPIGWLLNWGCDTRAPSR